MCILALKLILPYIIDNRYDGKVYSSCLSITFIDLVIKLYNFFKCSIYNTCNTDL